MPCYRCGARQTDPVRGVSPWRRGVRGDEQVLVCPACQQNPSWRDDLDRCVVCGCTALMRRLGATVCRDCEADRLTDRAGLSSGIAHRVTDAAAGREDAPGKSAALVKHDLAREVAAAIDRVLGRA